MSQQLMQIVFAEVVIVQLEQRFVRLLTKPQHRSLDQCLIPVDISNEPRSGKASELTSSRMVHQSSHIAMVLQIACWNAVGDRSFERFANNLGLVFA